jgi:hypothetical protein
VRCLSWVPAWLLTQDLFDRLLSAAPPGLVARSSTYPGLAPWAAFCRRFAAGLGWVRLIAALKRCATQRLVLRGAEAPLFHGRAGVSVCLKAYPDTNPPKSKSKATDRSVRSTPATSTPTSRAMLSAFVVPTSRKEREKWGTPFCFCGHKFKISAMVGRSCRRGGWR